MRSEDKWVPEEAIRNIYARFATQPVPSRIDVIKPNELYKILEKPIDLSQYKKIVFVGDIHGCYQPIQEYFTKFPYDEKTLYVFVGDYLDRGIQNEEVLQFLIRNTNKKNFLFIAT